MASLAQGAFMAVGAFTAAHLLRGGWDLVGATLAATALAGAAGLAVGAGAARLRGPFVALGTWVAAWLAAFALSAFPAISGGAQGLVLPAPFVGVPGGGGLAVTPAGLYEIALILVAAVLLVTRALERGAPGLALAAIREGPEAAETLGVRAARMRLGALVASAAVGGLAGALLVQAQGLADASAFGPLRSVELFVAVLIGGAGVTVGPVLGSAVLAAIPLVADLLGGAAGVDPVRFEPAVASVLLLGALLVGPAGIAGLLGLRGRRSVPAEPSGAPGPPGDARLVARGVAKSFGGVHALAGVDLALATGEIHALVGPNGSGKSTLLAILSGALAPDRGSVELGGSDVTDAGPAELVRRGLVRTLQPTTVFADLDPLAHAGTGTVALRRAGGAIRAALATPKARAETREMRGRAAEALGVVGVPAEDLPAARLDGKLQRLLMIATALSAGPRLLLLDEPTAGMSPAGSAELAETLRDLRGRGIGILLVAHDLALVRAVADRVTVLHAGTVLAAGDPEAVARDPAVVEAYLGR